MRRARGFTLIELLVVFAIMALVVSLAPMAFNRLRDSAQYRDVVRTIVSEMRTARHQAMTGRGEVRFVVDVGHRTYGLDGGVRHAIPEAVQLGVTVADVEMRSGVAAIRFLSDGGATGGSVDVVRAASGSGVRLRVDWLSGRVTQTPFAP